MFLQLNLQVLSREISNWKDLSKGIEYIKSILQPWELVCGGKEIIQELVINSIGSRLFALYDAKTCRKWLDVQLIRLEDFAAISEGAVQHFIRDEHSKYLTAIKNRQFPEAAQTYQDFKAIFPVKCLEDDCFQGRLRHLFDYALEVLNCEMNGFKLNSLIKNSIEPFPKTFSDTLKTKYQLKFDAEIAADFTNIGTLKQSIEQFAFRQGKDFFVHPSGKKIDGKQVYVLGNCFCYFDQDLIYAAKKNNDTQWNPVSINRLMEMC